MKPYLNNWYLLSPKQLTLFCLGILLGIGSVFAQKKNFTLAEAINGISGPLAPQGLKQLQWAGKTDKYTYVVQQDSLRRVMICDPQNFEPRVLIELSQLNQTLSTLGVSALKQFPALQFVDENNFTIQHEQKWIQVSKKQDRWSAELLNSFPAEQKALELEPVKKSIAYVYQHNVYVCARNGKPLQITRDGSEGLVYGLSVHRDEFGIHKGLFWSPLGNALAFYRMDQQMVEDYPIIDWKSIPAKATNIKYPFAGKKSHHVSVGVYNARSGRTVYLQTGEPLDQYLTCVSWSPDEKFLFVAVLNRDQNHLKLIRYDALSGKALQTLSEERSERYVEPQNPLYFPTRQTYPFVWWSQKDGFMHLYLCDSNGRTEALTQGKWLVNELLGFDSVKQELYFSASKEHPMQKQIYAVQLRSKEIRRISTQSGTHLAQLSASGQYMIDQFSNRDISKAIEVNRTDGLQEKRILTASNTLQPYALAQVRDITLYTSDQTALYGKLMLPDQFDSTKRYPVIVYLYNGPHVQLNKESFPYSGNLWYDYMTQKGYLVFVLDGRGSSNRGFDFESAIFRQLGTVEIQDQLSGVNYLKSLPYVDSTRMGVHGWSFGGFITTSLMLKHPGVFVCGVAGGPVLDWNMYEVMYTERYMDSPEMNMQGYADSRLMDKMKNLQGHLLLIHGTDDDVVLWQHSLLFLKKCVDEGVQPDYFVYPGHPHNVRGKDRVHLMQKVSDYFDQWLQPKS